MIPEAQTTEQKHIAELLAEYVSFLGVKNISQLPGLWEHNIDETWSIKCNGHTEAVDNVPPLSWSLSFNGWPAGIISVLGDGVICAGSEGNEDNLRAAILAKMN